MNLLERIVELSFSLILFWYGVPGVFDIGWVAIDGVNKAVVPQMPFWWGPFIVILGIIFFVLSIRELVQPFFDFIAGLSQ